MPGTGFRHKGATVMNRADLILFRAYSLAVEADNLSTTD